MTFLTTLDPLGKAFLLGCLILAAGFVTGCALHAWLGERKA